MDTKKTIIAGVVVVVLIIAGFVVFGKSSAPQPQVQNQNPQAVDQNGQPQVQGQDVVVGTGPQAVPGSIVSVLYEGKLQDGTVFDSSAMHGNQALTFTLGDKGMILGFQVGVNGMKEGGERTIEIPPELAYGSQGVTDSKTGKVIIPPNSALVFDIKLVKVSASAPDSSATSTSSQSTSTKPAVAKHPTTKSK